MWEDGGRFPILGGIEFRQLQLIAIDASYLADPVTNLGGNTSTYISADPSQLGATGPVDLELKSGVKV